jgi:hypothetical protein
MTFSIRIRMSASVPQMRQFWSLAHLWTARNAARRCSDIESRISNETTVNHEHQSLAITAVAGIPAPASALPALTQIWKKERSLGIRKKFQSSLTAVGQQQFDEAREPFASADLVIKLRDRFVHYKPEWQYLDANPPAATARLNSGDSWPSCGEAPIRSAQAK